MTADAAQDKRPKILVVEDNKVLSLTYQQMFQTVKELREFQLVLYESAWLALDWLSKLPEGDRPAVAILDWVMEGMNGLDLLQAIKKDPRWKDVPVMMVTSTGQREKVAQACINGVDDYIIKPLQTNILVKKLRYILSRPPKTPVV